MVLAFAYKFFLIKLCLKQKIKPCGAYKINNGMFKANTHFDTSNGKNRMIENYLCVLKT